MIQNLSKLERQRGIKEHISNDPFLSDKKLAELFNFSVQTIRLDRLEMGIPEMRKRIVQVAKNTSSSDKVKSLSKEEIVGEVVDLTGVARLSYKKPVYAGQTLVAKARIARNKGNKYLVSVHVKADQKEVFTGKLVIFTVDDNLKKEKN